MKTLWFKSCYVAPILAGQKRDTIRLIDRRRFEIGEIIALAVGPRPAFARARIVAIDEIAAESIAIDRLADVRKLMGERERYRRISFELIG